MRKRGEGLLGRIREMRNRKEGGVEIWGRRERERERVTVGN